MGLSQTQSICILLAIDTAFFLLEIIVGYAVHSLALVADAFHMFNDILSLLVGLWAVRVATNGKTSKIYTYGWQRAGTLGALVNGVFLVALCVTIVLEAIQRFVDPPEIENPRLVLIVGSCGLASNLLGLLLFHEHGHGHSHGHSHGHAHSPESSAEEGHSHGTKNPTKQGSAGKVDPHRRDASSSPTLAPVATSNGHDTGRNLSPNTPRKGSASRGRRSSASLYAFSDVQDIPTTARAIRQSVIQYGSMGADNIREDPLEEEDESAMLQNTDASEQSPLLSKQRSRHDSEFAAKTNGHSHHEHGHDDIGQSHGHGHSHGDLNMRGVFLHVMGDALGNIGVIASALFIWLTKYSWRFYADPTISLIITVIILCSAIPLCRATSRILLQGVPPGINIDAIKADVEDLEHVVSCHHLHVWQLSDTKLIASLHIQIEFKPEIGEDGAVQYDQARTLYMSLAKDIHLLLHDYGIASSTIQPEFCTDSTHRHLVSRASGEQTVVGDADVASGVLIDPAETCLLECNASCSGSVSGPCCEPSTTGGSTCGGASTGSSEPPGHVH